MASVTPIPRAASLSIGGTDMELNTGSTVTLDETTTYAVADLSIALDESSEDIDPRLMQRGIVIAAASGTARSFDLGVRERTIDHKNKTVRLRLASDEELLADYAPLEDNTTALDNQGSLVAIINNVLDTVVPAAELDEFVDVEFPVSWDAPNMILNPGAETGVHGMNVNDVSVAQSNLWAASETYSYLLFGPTSTDSYGFMNLFSYLGASRDQVYTASASCFINTPLGGSSSTLRRSIAVIITTSTGPIVYASDRAPNVTGVTRLAVTFKIPANALDAGLFFFHGHTVGDIWYDDLRLSPGDGIRDRDIDRLDGVLPDDDLYEYEWDDTPGNSVSRRTAFAPVPAETLIWFAGQSAWEFLLPIVNAKQRRLFCDEGRVWRLVDSDYTVAGTVTAQVTNTSQGDDTITRDGDLWADGVLVRYTWQDRFGATQTKVDAAGTEGKVRSVEFGTAYPGPGAAAAILARMNGQGRTQSAALITDYDATPGQEAVIELPGTGEQVGRLVSVQFDLNLGFMNISARGLTEA